MESHSKNKLFIEQILSIMAQAFPKNEILAIRELEEGYFNAAYLIKLDNAMEVILKVAPLPDTRIMSYEKNIMQSEVEAMRLVSQNTDVPVAKVYLYDRTCELCKAQYFIMEKLPGASLSSSVNDLSEPDKENIWYQVGKITYNINQITGERFGYLGQPELQGDEWFSVFKNMMALAIADAQKMEIDLKIDTSQLFAQYEQDKRFFSEVQIPQLVHWDLWDGNIFIQQSAVSGIIDFERAIWGDPFLEVGFRSYAQSDKFLEGYGITEFTESQKKRIWWYDVYLFLVVALEYKYRNYDSDETYVWATDMLQDYFSCI